MSNCTVPNCKNPAKFYDPIDRDKICQVCYDHLRSCGVKTEYSEITYPEVKSQPGKLWSPCVGENCNHPSHSKSAAE